MMDADQLLTEDMLLLIAGKSESLLKQHHGIVDSLDEIGGLLARYDPATSPILNAIDLKGQDLATYFFATYSDTRNVDKSIKVYKTIKALVRYVLLTDRFYEVGNRRYQKIARGLLHSIKNVHQDHLQYSIDFALKQFWPFWAFENRVKKHMLRGYTFSGKEIRHFNLFKSSDAPIVYARVLDNESPSFNPNVTLILHYNQALQDILDDFEDLEEDLHDAMPNVFLLAAVDYIPYSKLAANQRHARKVILGSGATDPILSLVEQYNKLIMEISIPKNFDFLKQLSRDYTTRLLRNLGVLR